MHAFEERQRKEGKPVNHEFAKELIASFAGAEVDKLVETKGLDYVDKEKAKHQAKQNAERLYDEQVSIIINAAPSTKLVLIQFLVRPVRPVRPSAAGPS